ncbi:hypothetical protein V6N13_100942 [Hibiscus sabdariffa]
MKPAFNLIARPNDLWVRICSRLRKGICLVWNDVRQQVAWNIDNMQGNGGLMLEMSRDLLRVVIRAGKKCGYRPLGQLYISQVGYFADEELDYSNAFAKLALSMNLEVVRHLSPPLHVEALIHQDLLQVAS